MAGAWRQLLVAEIEQRRGQEALARHGFVGHQEGRGAAGAVKVGVHSWLHDFLDVLAAQESGPHLRAAGLALDLACVFHGRSIQMPDIGRGLRRARLGHRFQQKRWLAAFWMDVGVHGSAHVRGAVVHAGLGRIVGALLRAWRCPVALHQLRKRLPRALTAEWFHGINALLAHDLLVLLNCHDLHHALLTVLTMRLTASTDMRACLAIWRRCFFWALAASMVALCWSMCWRWAARCSSSSGMAAIFCSMPASMPFSTFWSIRRWTSTG